MLLYAAPGSTAALALAFAVNIAGCFAMGLYKPGPLWGAGFLGGFTTFSTFSLDAAVLMQRGELAASATYMVVSVLFSVGGLFAGLFLIRGMVG